jgi:SAM-dependent methyltransferase
MSNGTPSDVGISDVSFDRYNESYNDELRRNLSIIPFHDDIEYYAEHKIQLLKEICPDAHSILEFGCGIGRNIRYLQQYYRSATITGTDVSDSCLSEARIVYPDVIFLPPRDIHSRLYDLILVADVIHHIPPRERDEYFLTLKTHLTDSGNIVIFEQNPYNPLTRYLVGTCPFDEDATLLSKTALKKILKYSGYKIISGSYCFFFPSALKKYNSLENRIGFLPLGGKYYIHAKKD